MLTIVVASQQLGGHLNACAGAMQDLVARGHRVVFVLSQAYKGKYASLGYVEHLCAESSDKPKLSPDLLAKMLISHKILGPYPPIEKALNSYKAINSYQAAEHYFNYNLACKEAIALYKPDLFFVDGILPPCVAKAGIPWVRCVSHHPIVDFHSPDLPPGNSGLPVDSDRTEWRKWDQVIEMSLTCSSFNDFFESHGYPRYPNDRWPETYEFTVYAYPDELNYPLIRDCEEWFNLEAFQKSKPALAGDPLGDLVPVDFLTESPEWSGKLIYVSLGSIGGVDLSLLRRLTEVLGRTKHRYIVSKGQFGDQLVLPPNQWGANYLPQGRILPLVDLVITHGGNNTLSETFIEGKPMIVFPLFRDQYDNAQRLQETGWGVRLDTYQFTSDELCEAIEKLLADEELSHKLEIASKRIKALNRHEELAIKIESLFNGKQ